MALFDARNSLLLLAGVRRPYGEPEPTPEQQEQADKVATIVRFDWEPGNGTRYGLTYTIREAPSLSRPESPPLQNYTLTWHGPILADGRELPPSVGLSFSWDECSYTNGPWFANQVGINHADADGLLLLLDALGHAISYCNDDPARTVPQPRTPVLVQEIEGVTNANA